MPYVNLPGVQLWHEDTGGAGTPVVLLHAASGNCDCWIHQLPEFTRAGYRCIAYDRWGWGRSRPAANGEPPCAGSDDLQGLVDHLGLPLFHLVATAAGAIVAFDYAVSHQDRLRSLVIANTISGVQNPEYLEVQHRVRPPQIQGLPIELRELGASYRAIEPEGTARWIEIERRSRQDHHAPAQPLRNRLTYALLETLRVPTLLIAGEADLVTPPALMRLPAAHIPNCQFVKIPEAGHAAFWEQPALWNRHVLEFIGRH